jgi:hypothetical protein
MGTLVRKLRAFLCLAFLLQFLLRFPQSPRSYYNAT